jgi:hypothetical protein
MKQNSTKAKEEQQEWRKNEGGLGFFQLCFRVFQLCFRVFSLPEAMARTLKQSCHGDGEWLRKDKDCLLPFPCCSCLRREEKRTEQNKTKDFCPSEIQYEKQGNV